MKPRVTRRQVDVGVGLHRIFVGKKRLFDNRTIRVLGSLVIGMTLISSILLALKPPPGARSQGWSLSAIDLSTENAKHEILVEPGDLQWNFIIIHDSNGVTGGAEELNNAWNRHYKDQGMSGDRGAGYHFVIHDRHGDSDGQIQIARRWKDQLPGDYITGEQADTWNRQAIGICMMGDADKRPFSDDQVESVVKLVRMLQEAYGISRDRIYVPADYSSAPFFPRAAFYNQILD